METLAVRETGLETRAVPMKLIESRIPLLLSFRWTSEGREDSTSKATVPVEGEKPRRTVG